MSGLKVCVVGAGSLGCLFAARLASAKCAVTLVQRSRPGLQNTLSEVCVHELGEAGTRKETVQLANGLDSLTDGRFDVVLVLTKVKDTLDVGQGLHRAMNRRIVDGDTRIVTLQNGLGNKAVLEDALGIHHVQNRQAMKVRPVFHGLTYTGAVISSPLVSEHRGIGKTFIACAEGEDEVLVELAQAYNHCFGVQDAERLVLCDNTDSMAWTKLLVNSIINPITAILDKPNECILAPRIQPLVEQAAEEFERVARAEGVELDFGLCHTGAEYVSDIARRTGPNITSMLADVRAGRETEIDFFNGFVMKVARKHGIKVPVQESLYHLVKTMHVGKSLT